MNDILPPFTISSHPNPIQSSSSSQNQNHSFKSDTISTKPVIRFTRSIKKKIKSNSSNESAQVITTVPGEGWSIHNVSNQAILSSQKLSPNLVLSTPCVSVSLPKCEVSNEPAESSSVNHHIKSRVRYVYAAVASSPAHPSGPVNEGRTVWVWMETEVRGGYGERITSNSEKQDTDSPANMMKEFDSRVKMIHLLPQTHHAQLQKQSDSKSSVAVRVMVLLESGDLVLCDQDLSIIMTCRSPSPTKSPTNQKSSHDLLRMQAVVDSIEQDDSATTLSSILGSNTKRPESLVLYITRAKAVLRQAATEELPSGSPATNGRSKKRKSGPIAKLAPTKSIPQVSHYSSLDIDLYEIALDNVHAIGHLSSKQDLFDVAIGAHGWVTILGYDQILRSFRLTPDSQNDKLLSVKTLSLDSQVKFPPLDLSPCFAGLGPVSKITPLPTLQPQYAATPMVILFMSHSTTTEDPIQSCHCLMIDHYHRAVLYSHLSPWPGSQTQESFSSSPNETSYPLTISSELASIHNPSYVYLAQSGNGRRLVQAFQLPKSFASGPTWVDVLNPAVVKATTTWIKSQHSSGVTTSSSAVLPDKKSIPDLLMASISSVESELPPSDIHDAQIAELSKLVERLNEAWSKTPDSDGAWDKSTANAAEAAWVEWVNQQSKWTAQAVFDTASHDVKLKPLSNGGEPMVISENGITKPEGGTSEGGKPAKKSSRATTTKPIQFTLPKAFVEIIIRMCLDRFIILPTASAKENNGIDGVTNLQKEIYPSKILTSLLNMSLVEDDMISGGFFSTLRRTKDWFNIGLSISKLLDLHEEHLIETIQEVIQFESKLPKTDEANGTDKFVKQSHLKPLLANIILQPLSSPALRKALREKLTTEEVAIVLDVLNEWIVWWAPNELDNQRVEDEVTGNPVVTKNMDPDKMQVSSPSKKLSKGRPKIKKVDGVIVPALDYIINFVTCCLDSHLVGLIQFTKSIPTMKSIQSCISNELETIKSLQNLNVSINQMNQMFKTQQALEIKKRREMKKAKRNVKGNGNGKGKLEKTKEEKKCRREEMWEANLAVGEYSVESFVF